MMSLFRKPLSFALLCLLVASTNAGLQKFRLPAAVERFISPLSFSPPTNETVSLSPAAQILKAYLDEGHQRGGVRPKIHVDRDFHIQGWKWHTMSLVRESTRLNRAAALWGAELWDTTALHTVCEHVVNFNMRGLQNIESQTFFPWVRQRLTKALQGQEHSTTTNILSAFQSVMNELESSQKNLRKLGNELLSLSAPSKSRLSKSQIDSLWHNVATKSALLRDQAQSMLDTERAVLIPLICCHIPANEQNELNGAVLRRLGVWDARLHLVGMYETCCRSPREYAIFQRRIPKLAQRMIPRWKRLLYDPVMGNLPDLEEHGSF